MLSVAKKMLVWRIHVASNNKTSLGLDVKCPILNMSGVPQQYAISVIFV
jgi:hypothetical protein